jgi:hypothetical protein
MLACRFAWRFTVYYCEIKINVKPMGGVLGKPSFSTAALSGWLEGTLHYGHPSHRAALRFMVASRNLGMRDYFFNPAVAFSSIGSNDWEVLGTPVTGILQSARIEYTSKLSGIRTTDDLACIPRWATNSTPRSTISFTPGHDGQVRGTHRTGSGAAGIRTPSSGESTPSQKSKGFSVFWSWML